MKRSLLPAFLALLASAAPAFANSRSAVSVNGIDSNPCTVASPCRSFGAALAVTSPGGEVIALDSAGYGAFTVSTGMTVSGAPGVHAAISVSAGDAVFVNAAAGDLVTISNLTMISSGANHGVAVAQAGDVRVLNCYLTGFFSSAMRVVAGRLTVDRCVVVDTTSSAILANGTTSPVSAVITNTLLDNNNAGITAQAAASVTVSNCTIAGGTVAVSAFSQSGTSDPAHILVESSTICNSGIAVQTDASGGNNTAIIYLAQDDIAFCPVGVQTAGTGQVFSFGNNRIVDVPTVGPLSLTSLQ